MSSKHCPKCGILSSVEKLEQGNVVPIWMRKDSGEEYLEFYGKLERFISADGEPYPFFLECPRCGKQINAVTEKWEVTRMDDKFIENISYVRNVRRFHSFGVFSVNSYSESDDALLFKGYCVDFLDNDPIACARLKREIQGKEPKSQLLKDYLKYCKRI